MYRRGRVRLLLQARRRRRLVYPLRSPIGLGSGLYQWEIERLRTGLDLNVTCVCDPRCARSREGLFIDPIVVNYQRNKSDRKGGNYSLPYAAANGFV